MLGGNMKKTGFFFVFIVVSMSLWAWEDQDCITEYYWFIEKSDGVYEEWAGYDIDPHGLFFKYSIPRGATIYRNRLRNKHFFYFYQTDKDKAVSIELKMGMEPQHIVYYVNQRDNYSYLRISKGYYLYVTGDRNGGQSDSTHPLVGIWGKLPFLSEIRLVKPDNYCYYLEIPDKMPGYAIRHGTYLFKQVGDKVFETDSSFPDGHMRLEIQDKNEDGDVDWLVLTPLFKLPNEEGLVQPLYMKRYHRPLKESE
jgi:hypothetical protein